MKNNIVKSIYGHPYGNGFVLGKNTHQHDYRGSTVEVMLGRQGCSKTLNCSHPAFFIQIGEQATNGRYYFELCYSSGDEGRRRYGFHYNGQRIETLHHINSFELAKEKLIKAVAKKFGITLVIRDEVHAYSFSSYYDYDATDIRLARVAYCEEKNCMVDLVTGSALLKFAETPKSFDITSVKARADDIRKFMKESYTVLVDEDYCRVNHIDMEKCLQAAFGFYICEYDTKQGVERCKRQAVHLFNNSLMVQDTQDKINAPYFEIPRDMSTPDWFLVSDQKEGERE